MKRLGPGSAELKRTAPIKRSPLPPRTKPIARSEWKPKRSKSRGKTKRKRSPNEFADEVKAEVRRRSGNRCEVQSRVCTGRAVDFHHRKSRRFGDNRVCNCLHVCVACHRYLEANRVLARLMGWIVHSTLDSADVPVRRGSGPVKETA